MMDSNEGSQLHSWEFAISKQRKRRNQKEKPKGKDSAKTTIIKYRITHPKRWKVAYLAWIYWLTLTEVRIQGWHFKQHGYLIVY